MYTSRRDFMKTGGMALAGATLFSGELYAARKAKEIMGIQLYSIRDEMKADPLATLKQLAEIGYKYVEHAGYADRKYYTYPVAEFKKILGDLGMKMLSGHSSLGRPHWDKAKNDFTDEWKYTVEDAATVGQQYVISPWLDESFRVSMDEMKGAMEMFNKCGELCKKSGIKFGYHNHDFEFNTTVDNMKIYDIILQNTDPSLVAQQLDIGNMYHAGAKAEEVLKQYPGRFESMHVKDEIKSPTEAGKYESTVLGAGIIPVKQIVDMGRKSGGTSHFIIEQESYQGKTPIECVKEDFKIMKKWGY